MTTRLVPELLSETLVRLSHAGDRFPGGGVSPSCIERWIRKGVRGVKLETCKIGGIRYTSEEAIQRFLAGQNQNLEYPEPAIPRLNEAEILRRKQALGI